MGTESRSIVGYRFMTVLALIVGIVGFALQFLPGWEFFTFFLCLAVLGGLIGGSGSYDERGRQRLRNSYKIAFEWLLLLMMAAYAFVELPRWLPAAEAVVDFLNGHWPGLVIALMCALMGISGFLPDSGS